MSWSWSCIFTVRLWIVYLLHLKVSRAGIVLEGLSRKNLLKHMKFSIHFLKGCNMLDVHCNHVSRMLLEHIQTESMWFDMKTKGFPMLRLNIPTTWERLASMFLFKVMSPHPKPVQHTSSILIAVFYKPALEVKQELWIIYRSVSDNLEGVVHLKFKIRRLFSLTSCQTTTEF